MKIAILMTNTDESDFAARHPKDGKKFTDFIQLVRPEWEPVVFSVKDGDFPSDIAEFDGFIITGSPASVGDDADWIQRLMSLIREIHVNKIPMFGACFGHQNGNFHRLTSLCDMLTLAWGKTTTQQECA